MYTQEKLGSLLRIGESLLMSACAYRPPSNLNQIVTDFVGHCRPLDEVVTSDIAGRLERLVGISKSQPRKYSLEPKDRRDLAVLIGSMGHVLEIERSQQAQHVLSVEAVFQKVFSPKNDFRTTLGGSQIAVYSSSNALQAALGQVTNLWPEGKKGVLVLFKDKITSACGIIFIDAPYHSDIPSLCAGRVTRVVTSGESPTLNDYLAKAMGQASVMEQRWRVLDDFLQKKCAPLTGLRGMHSVLFFDESDGSEIDRMHCDVVNELGFPFIEPLYIEDDYLRHGRNSSSAYLSALVAQSRSERIYFKEGDVALPSRLSSCSHPYGADIWALKEGDSFSFLDAVGAIEFGIKAVIGFNGAALSSSENTRLLSWILQAAGIFFQDSLLATPAGSIDLLPARYVRKSLRGLAAAGMVIQTENDIKMASGSKPPLATWLANHP